MAHPVTRIRAFFAKEMLSVHLIFIAFVLNVIAWVIPRGDYRYPARDPLGAAAFVSEQFTSIENLYYFWNGGLALSALMVGYSACRILSLGAATLSDRVDL